MWIYFSKTGRITTQLVHGTMPRQGSVGDFKVVAFFNEIDIQSAFLHATIQFRRPDGAISSEYVMTKEVRTFTKLEGELTGSVAPFVDGTDYSVFEFTQNDSEILEEEGRAEFTIRIYDSPNVIICQGRGTFEIEASVLTDPNITTSQYEELMTELLLALKAGKVGAITVSALTPDEFSEEEIFSYEIGAWVAFVDASGAFSLYKVEYGAGGPQLIEALRPNGTIIKLGTMPENLAPYEGKTLMIWNGVDSYDFYEIKSGAEEHTVFSSLYTNKVGTSRTLIEFTEDQVVLESNGIKHYFGYNDETTVLPLIYKKSEVNTLLATAKADIQNGTTIAKKAEQDELGQNIKSTYIKSANSSYSANTIELNLLNGAGAVVDTETIILPKATQVLDGLMPKEDKAYIASLPSALALKENKSEKGVANGYASLDSGAKVPSSQLPDSIVGQLEYKGTFAPNSGYPSAPEKGWFYISIGNATISGEDYKVGDWAVYNGTSWDKIDNTDAVASVNGKLGVVVLYGTEIQVGNGDTWSVEQRIVNLYAELNNRYTKAQTYSATQIEQRITDLLGLANLQDTQIEFSVGVNTLSYNGSVISTFPSTLVSPYNWVFLIVLVGTQIEYAVFNPSISVDGELFNLPLTSKNEYAQIKRVGSNYQFALYKKSDNTLSDTTATLRMRGIKLDGINSTEVEYSSGVSVKQKLDEKVDIVNLETTLETANYTGNRTPMLGFAGMAVPFKKSMLNGYDIKSIKTNISTENVSLPINITISLLNSLSDSPSAEVITVRTIDTLFTANGEFEYNVNFTNEELPDNFLIGIRFKAASTGTGHLNLNVGTINSSWNSMLGTMSPMYSNNGATVIWLYGYGSYKNQTMLLTLNKIKEIAYEEELTDYAKKNDYLSKTQLDYVDGGSGKLYQNNLLVKSSQLVVDNSIIDVPTSYDLVVGDTFELFYKGIIKATNIDDYIIEAVAPFGKALSRKFIANSITNANLGNNTLTLKVYDKYWNLLETKSTTLIVRDVLTSPLTNKNILCIGDSLTAGGEWVNELNRRLTSNTSIASNGDIAPLGLSLNNITFVGKEGTTVKHEGHSGWNYNSYITSGSPFMYSGVIDFQAYCVELGISGIDEVYILLGWNSWSVSLSTYKTQIKTLLDALITFNSNIKIVLLGVQIPSQDGVGDDYGASTPNFRQLWNRVFEYNTLYKEVSSEYLGKVKFVNLSGQFDSEYNMPNLSTNPNTRNKASSIIEGNNGVHPTVYGYYQIADAVYRAMHDMI